MPSQCSAFHVICAEYTEPRLKSDGSAFRCLLFFCSRRILLELLSPVIRPHHQFVTLPTLSSPTTLQRITASRMGPQNLPSGPATARQSRSSTATISTAPSVQRMSLNPGPRALIASASTRAPAARPPTLAAMLRRAILRHP